MEYIVIGQIIKPQGIMGEVKIKALTDNSERFKKLKLVYINNTAYKISSMRISGEFVFLKFIGVDDRNAAELLRNKFISIDKINAVELKDGSYFISDLIGCDILSENGENLGKITDILQYGAADVITAKFAGSTFSFPFLKQIVKNIDIQNKTFIVYSSKLAEVRVDND